MTMKVQPRTDCPACHGRGEVANVVPYGSTTAIEWLLCDCVTEQVPESYSGGIAVALPPAEVPPGDYD